MIDWTKEIATKNYCGYCDRTPTGHNCDGGCFTRKDFTEDEKSKNKVDHVLEMLKTIPEKIKELKRREQEYKDSLSA